MKLTKLLTGAAVAALISGAASAQYDITANNGAGFGDGTATYYIANEIDLASEIISGVQTIAIEESAAGVFAAATEGRLTLNLSGGVFNGNQTVATLVDNAAAGVCEAADFTLVSGGGSGDSQAVLVIDTSTGCGNAANPIDIDLPFVLTSSTFNVSSTFRTTATNVAIDGGSGTIDADGNAANGNTPIVSGASGLTILFDDNSPQATLASSLSELNTATLGTIDVIAGARLATVAGVLNYTGDDVNVDLAGTAVAPGDFDSGEVTLTFESLTGLDATEFASSADATPSISGNTVTFTFATGDVHAGGGTGAGAYAASAAVQTITIDDDGDAATSIQAQDVAVTAAASADAASVMSDDSATGEFTITRAGNSEGPFEWFGGTAASTQSIVRVAGLGATSPRILVTLDNTVGDAADGEYELTAGGDATNNGEYIITAAMIEDAVGATFLRSDVSFTYETNTVGNTRRFGFNGSGALTDFAFDPNRN